MLYSRKDEDAMGRLKGFIAFFFMCRGAHRKIVTDGRRAASSGEGHSPTGFIRKSAVRKVEVLLFGCFWRKMRGGAGVCLK